MSTETLSSVIATTHQSDVVFVYATEPSLHQNDWVQADLPTTTGYGGTLLENLHHQLDDHIISPQLAYTLKMAFIAAEEDHPGILENLAIKGGRRPGYASVEIDDQYHLVNDTARLIGVLGIFENYDADRVLLEWERWHWTDEPLAL